MKGLLEREEGVFFRFETFTEMSKGLERLLSPTVSSVILAFMGRSCGERSCRRIMGEAKSREKALKRLFTWKRKENWGELTFQSLNSERGYGRVVVKNSFEARARGTSSSVPCCHFFRGFLAGFLSELFGKPITVLEERCAAKGDERCEFSFASSIVLYAKEAIRIRDEMIKERVLRQEYAIET